MSLSLKEFSQRLMVLLPRLMREIALYERNYLTEGKITHPQFLVLDHLLTHGPCQMTELAEIMHLKCSSMTGLVDRLFRDKLVHRSRIDQDRRVVEVEATKKAKKIVGEILTQKQKGVMGLFGRLGEKERATYLEILEKLFHDLSADPVQRNEYEKSNITR